jgi:hypothetical protein
MATHVIPSKSSRPFAASVLFTAVGVIAALVMVLQAKPAAAIDNNESVTDCDDFVFEGEGGPESREFCLEVEPTRALNETFSTHFVSAELTDDGEPEVEDQINLLVTSGPHEGTTDDDSTDSFGQATLEYFGTAEGTDTIEVSWEGFFCDCSEPDIVLTVEIRKTWADCHQSEVDFSFQDHNELCECFSFEGEIPSQCCPFVSEREEVAGGCESGGGGSGSSDGASRCGGDDRIETAIEIASCGPIVGRADVALLARDDVFADALVATPLAVDLDAPLLLNPSDELDPDVLAELDSLGADTVVIVGGPDAISAGVESELNDEGFTTERVAGQDRYLTAVDVAGELGNPSTILLASGQDFPDAATAGVAAAEAGGAVLLTMGATQSPTTQQYLDDHTIDELFAIGGPAVTADPSAQVVSGDDRFDTAARVAEEFFGAPDEIGVANAVSFPEALTGGVHIARLGGPLLLVNVDDLPAFTFDYLDAHSGSIDDAFIYGGTDVISDEVRDDVEAAI